MTTIRILALFATCSLTPVLACSHVQQVADDCHATSEIVSEIDRIIAHDTYEAEIAALNLAICIARDAVTKEQAAVSSDSSALSAHDPVANAKLMHAQAWLSAHGGPAPVTIKAGFPGGGHNCCWRTGTWSTIVNPPSCPAPSVPLTSSNLPSHCACAPVGLWC